jgi:predicted ribosome quality control (RQC) complex YloA/Tae2 family protein
LRKLSVLLTIFLVAATAAACATGCSSEESTAREYLEQARAKTKDVAANQEKEKKKGEELNTLLQQISDPPTAEEAQKMKQLTSELSGLIDDSNKQIQKTRTEYEKILKLNDVKDYKIYARNRIEVLAILDQLATLHLQYWEIYDQAFDDYLAAGSVDEEAIKAVINQILEQKDKLDTELEKLDKEAADLADELDIQ